MELNHMLVRQGRAQFANPGKFTGTVSGQSGNIVKGGFRNRFAGGTNGLTKIFGGYANGHLGPSSFVLPQSSGSISSYTESRASMAQGVIVLTLAIPADASGSMVLTANTASLDLLVELIASGTLVLSVDSAVLSSAVDMIVNGSMNITVNSAILGGIFGILANGTMIIVPSGTITAEAFMEAASGGPTPLSPEGLANAVWSQIIESDYTSSELLRLLVAVAAGKTDIVDLGGGLATVKFRDILDTKDRVTASMTDSERTTVTLDLT
jgi:hypothetical protein